MQNIRIEQHGVWGGVWIGAWLFTIGYLQLGWFEGALALLLWPYYLGVAFAG